MAESNEILNVDTDELGITEETLITRTGSVSCKGFEIAMESGSVLSRYPFHRHDSDCQDISTFINFNISLNHSIDKTSLVAHAQSCNGTVSTSVLEKINNECAEIKYSPLLNKLIEVD